MSDVEIFPYSPADDEAALALEEKCVQGTSLKITFRRPDFRARSELYENARIYCARRDGKLIGIIAGALKDVRLHGEMVRALYFYDLRVHPAFRNGGVGKKLTNAVIDDLGKNADCLYTLVNGENAKAMNLARRNFAPKAVIPLTYALFPVYKKRKEREAWRFEKAADLHASYERAHPDLEFMPLFREERLSGYVMSLILEKRNGTGCSIWTNENILAEQVTQIPSRMRRLRALSRALSPFVRLPHIPADNEIIRSWFLFDFHAEGPKELRSLLAAVNNLALARGRTYFYILVRDGDPLLGTLRAAGPRFITFPYRLLAKGRVFPLESDDFYIDIRDL
jgi:ribosomal protein S18 acetylase RimI-like enzyme